MNDLFGSVDDISEVIPLLNNKNHDTLGGNCNGHVYDTVNGEVVHELDIEEDYETRNKIFNKSDTTVSKDPEGDGIRTSEYTPFFLD